MSSVLVAANASGAVLGAKLGNVVMVVDVIDMSTSLESALDGGALEVYGASPDATRAPVSLDPEGSGYQYGMRAKELETTLVLIGEPRLGTEEERKEKMRRFLEGVRKSGAVIEAILPNIGAEVAKMEALKGKVVVAVTSTGGVAFEAAWVAGAPRVLTGTIARTLTKRGTEPLKASALRAVEAAREYRTGITLVAASANSYEDVLAVQEIQKEIINLGFTQING